MDIDFIGLSVSTAENRKKAFLFRKELQLEEMEIAALQLLIDKKGESISKREALASFAQKGIVCDYSSFANILISAGQKITAHLARSGYPFLEVIESPNPDEWRLSSEPLFTLSRYHPKETAADFPTPQVHEKVNTYGGFSQGATSQTVVWRGRALSLTRTSKKLMAIFIAAASETVSRKKLFAALGRDVKQVSISTYVSDLRAELAENFVKFGYPRGTVIIDTIGQTGWRLMSPDTDTPQISGQSPAEHKSVDFHGFKYGGPDNAIFFNGREIDITGTQKKILTILLRAAGGKVLGSEIARALEIGSYAMWRHMANLRDRLEAFGFPQGMIVRTGKGYYLDTACLAALDGTAVPFGPPKPAHTPITPSPPKPH